MEKIKNFLNGVKDFLSEAWEGLLTFINENWLWIVTYILLIVIATPKESDLTWRSALAGVWVIFLAFFHIVSHFENK